MSKSFEKVEAEIVMLNTATHQICTVWHPDAAVEIIATGQGNVRVVKGDVAQYQLSTGDIVPL